MNRYIMIRRLRGPAFLLLVGVIALLNQADILSWGHAWPLFLILAGVLALAERAAGPGSAIPPYPDGSYPGGPNPGAPYPPPYPGAPYQGPPYQGQPYPGAPATPAAPGTSIVPTHNDEFGRGPNGGQS